VERKSGTTQVSSLVGVPERAPEAFGRDHLAGFMRVADAADAAAEALIAALEARDGYTADHSRAAARLAVSVAEQLEISAAERREIHYAALLHDIGKLAVPDAILHKRGGLTREEHAEIRHHPLVSEEILSSLPFPGEVRRIVRHAHERWDGEGYPDGLAGEDIPIGARIVLVVDAYHTMISDRPYQRRMSLWRARAELCACAGSQFDPDVVEAMIEVLDFDGPPLMAAARAQMRVFVS
jgi:putative nucleotidyltransferase with HDIG domain